MPPSWTLRLVCFFARRKEGRRSWLSNVSRWEVCGDNVWQSVPFKHKIVNNKTFWNVLEHFNVILWFTVKAVIKRRRIGRSVVPNLFSLNHCKWSPKVVTESGHRKWSPKVVTESGHREHFFIFSGTQFNQCSNFRPTCNYKLDDRVREQERSFKRRRMVSAGGGSLSSKLCTGRYDHREFYRDWWASW